MLNKKLNALKIDFESRGNEIVLGECPYCAGDTSKSSNQFKLSINEEKGVFHCFRCDEKGGIGKLFATLMDSSSNIKLITDNANEKFLCPHFESAEVIREKESLGARYFDNRGLIIPNFSDIRFHPAVPFHEGGNEIGKFPAIITKISDSSGTQIGSHFIYLDINGNKAPLESAKKIKGRVKGGFIALGIPSHEIGVAEGLETSLAIHQATGQTIYCCFHAYGLRDFQVPSGTKIVHIWADKDRSRKGESVANELATRLHRLGITTYVHLPRQKLAPDQKSFDFLDVLNYCPTEFQEILEAPIRFNPNEHSWPKPISQEGRIGTVGQMLRLFGPSSEADPNAHIIQFLTIIGNLIERKAKVAVGIHENHPFIFTVIVGSTAKGRKGTGLADLKKIFWKYFKTYWKSCTLRGISSGEGIIFQIRDPIIVKTKNKDGVEVEEVTDQGNSDKRLLITEEEFVQVLTASSRSGSTVTNVLRTAWDGEHLQVASRHTAIKASDPSISSIGQITPEELKKCFNNTDAANGFGNRILWCMSRKSKSLPLAPPLDEIELEHLCLNIWNSILSLKEPKTFQFSHESTKLWKDEMYKELEMESDANGLYSKVIARGLAYVPRIALIYAVLDRSSEIQVEHLRAAKAVWNYCRDSAFYLFSGVENTPSQRKILKALQSNDTGLSRTQISELFGKHKTSRELDSELEELLDLGLVANAKEPTKGRHAERWFIP